MQLWQNKKNRKTSWLASVYALDSPIARLVVTLFKTPKLAAFVVLCIYITSLTSVTWKVYLLINKLLKDFM